ncbi:hypothetical protein ACWEO4_36870 [Streptomyces sp. NPDC004393]|uniref:hypothetical protein n=1 Tax=Streptomyces sp. NPDC004533 TaxID=3154278 RepID=UPI0033BAECD6
MIIPGEVLMFPKDFAADLGFLLDCVEALAAGRNPDVDGKQLPQGLLGALDPQCIGAFGWSKGGTATALTMLADQRVRAGLSLDGPMQRHRGEHLLEGPSVAFPDVKFIP